METCRPQGFHKMAPGSPNAHFVWNSALNSAHNSNEKTSQEREEIMKRKKKSAQRERSEILRKKGPVRPEWGVRGEGGPIYKIFLGEAVFG